MAGTVIRPEKLLGELNNLWAGLGVTAHDEGITAVLRACAMTLVVLTDAPADDPALGETLAALMPQHPSRVVVVEVSDGNRRSMEAKVAAQCWKPFGSRQQICCEQIVIQASSRGLGDLPPVLRALLAPDLPVVLWSRSLDLTDPETAGPVIGLADKMILNSTGVSDPLSLLRRIEALQSGGRIVADLSWTRLTRWRETIAQMFANAERRPLLGGTPRATVRHYGDRPAMRAYYAAAWLRCALGGRVDVRLAPADRAPCQPDGEVAALTIEGDGPPVSITQLEGEAVEIRAGDLVRRTVFQRLNDCALLREELSIEGRDPLYEKVLDEVRRLAG